MTDEQQHNEHENLEASGYGAKVSVPRWAGEYIGPYLKYGIIVIMVSAGIGLLVVLVCYGLSMVMK